MPTEAMEVPEQAALPKTYQTSEKGLRMATELRDRSLQERYDNSPVMNAVSIEEQAQRCPSTFVGNCVYFDLNARNHENLQGEYRIVYTYSWEGEQTYRGKRYNVNAETFTPSSKRSIIVKTNIRQTERGTAMNAAFRAECWAGVEVVFNNESMCLGLDESVPPYSIDFPNGAPARLMQPPTPNGISPASAGRLDKVLEMGINGSGDNHAFFGLKPMQEYFDYDKDKMVTLGFEFLQLELDCVDPQSGCQDIQVIIAVKLKLNDDDKDVGSPFLLMQQIDLPSDGKYVQHMEESEQTYL